MTRLEHIQFCKDRANAYLNQHDVVNAITSMLSDLEKHEETKHTDPVLVMLGMFYAMNRDTEGARRFINGFN